MKTEDQVRKQVSKAYAKAVTSTNNTGCCSCGDIATKGAVARLAGYTVKELAELPAEAAVNAFGCGNPVAFSEIGLGESVLDLGSGAGIDLLLAAKKVGPQGKVIGIDMTDEMIEKAQENIKAAGLENVEVRKGIIEELPVEDNSVDWVISNCVINLSPEKTKVFAEIARVLKPGGKMLVSDIVAQDLPPAIRQSADLHNSCVAGAISEEEYLAGLTAVGLQDLEVRQRLVYDANQIKAFVDSEQDNIAAACCGNSNIVVDDKVIEQIEGKIWSAQIFGRKA
jgi:SAM-dependent methyltransferase